MGQPGFKPCCPQHPHRGRLSLRALHARAFSLREEYEKAVLGRLEGKSSREEIVAALNEIRKELLAGMFTPLNKRSIK
jgi:hypothetical protein